MHGLRMLGCRIFASAYRPNRFVGNYRLRECAHAALADHRVELSSNNHFCHACFAVLQRLADTQDGHESSMNGRVELGGNHYIALAENSAALRMTGDRITASELKQHCRVNRARISAGTERAY